MKYKITTSKGYAKKAAKFLKIHPQLANVYLKTLRLLERNPRHPSLRLHKLKGRKCFSVSINMSYRIILNFIIKDHEIFLIDIGNHNQIY